MWSIWLWGWRAGHVFARTSVDHPGNKSRSSGRQQLKSPARITGTEGSRERAIALMRRYWRYEPCVRWAPCTARRKNAFPSTLNYATMSARRDFSRFRRSMGSKRRDSMGRVVKTPSPQSPASTEGTLARALRWKGLGVRYSLKYSPRSPVKWARRGCQDREPCPLVTRSARASGTKIPFIDKRPSRVATKSVPSSPRHNSGQTRTSALSRHACSRACVGRPQPSTPA